MYGKATLFLLLPGLMLAQSVAFAGSDLGIQQWLERMSAAAHELDYDGTFIYSHEGHLQVMRILHSNVGGVERERLLSLSGPLREVVRDKERVTCILPENDSVTEDTGPSRRLPVNLPSRLDALSRYYRFSEAGSDRVAGHRTHKLLITPRDTYRYGHAFWLHQEQGLLLRADLYNEEGQVLEQLIYTHLRLYDRLPAELLEPETQGRDSVWQRGATDLESSRSERHWRFVELPPGFMLENHRQHIMASGRQVEHFLFSDGLASVSVFIEPEEADGGLVSSLRLGAVNTYARSKQRYLITAMGEVPLRTVREIADALRMDE